MVDLMVDFPMHRSALLAHMRRPGEHDRLETGMKNFPPLVNLSGWGASTTGLLFGGKDLLGVSGSKALVGVGVMVGGDMLTIATAVLFH